MKHRPRHAPKRTSRRDERGVVALFAVLMLAVLVVSSAFVVDLGMQRVARSDMQTLADVVALDLARELDGRTVATLTPILTAKAAESVSRNGGTVGTKTPIKIQLGTVGTSGAFTPMTSGVPTAVSVSAATTVAFGFAGFTGRDSGSATKRAAAEASATACFRLGSFVAAIRSGDSTVLAPLNGLLGVNLDLVSYKALAASDLRLAQLAADPRIGSPTALLDGTVQYATLLDVMVQALKQESNPANTVAITALTTLSKSAMAATVGPVRLGDVLHVAPSDRAALQVDFDVLDIVGSARLADGDYFLAVPNLQAGVPGIGNQFSGGIHLVSAAELACGKPNSPDAVADNTQLAGTMGIDFINMPSLNIAGIGTLQTSKGVGALVAEVGKGVGSLVAPPEVKCGANTAADPSTFTVKLATALATYRLDADLTVEGGVQIGDLKALGLGPLLTNLLGGLLGGNNSKTQVSVDVRLSIGSTMAGQNQLLNLSIPPNDVDPLRTGSPFTLDPSTAVATVLGVRIGGVNASLSAVTSLTSKITNELLTDKNGLLPKTLVPLVANINQDFIGPVARMVGLRMAGADTFAVTARCGSPRLVE